MTSDLRSGLRTGLLVCGVVVLGSVPVALLWWLVAPVPALVVRGGNVLLADGETEVAVAADGWFAACSAAAGVVAALVVFARLRPTRLGALLGLGVGGLLAAMVAWRLGVLLGPDAVGQSARGRPDGSRFDGPLRLSAHGVLVAWPLASMFVTFVLTAGLHPSTASPAGRRWRRGYDEASVDATRDDAARDDAARDDAARDEAAADVTVDGSARQSPR